MVPLALTLLVCLPATLTLTWLLARSQAGRLLGMPSADGMPAWQYLRLLLGFPASRASEDDWDRFSEMLSQVALGRVRPWDRLGPDEPAQPDLGHSDFTSSDFTSSDFASSGMPGSGQRDGYRGDARRFHPAGSSRLVSARGNDGSQAGGSWLSGVKVGGVQVTPLRVVLTVLVLMLLVLLLRPAGTVPAASPLAGAAALRLGVPWQPQGSGVAALISPQSSPLLVRALGDHGYDRGCARLSADSSLAAPRPGAVDEASPRGPWLVLCSASNGTYRVVVQDAPDGFLVLVSAA